MSSRTPTTSQPNDETLSHRGFPYPSRQPIHQRLAVQQVLLLAVNRAVRIHRHERMVSRISGTSSAVPRVVGSETTTNGTILEPPSPFSGSKPPDFLGLLEWAILGFEPVTSALSIRPGARTTWCYAAETQCSYGFSACRRMRTSA